MSAIEWTKNKIMINKQAKKSIFKTIKEISYIIIVEETTPISNYKTYGANFISFDNIVVSGIDNIINFHNLIDEIWTKHKLIQDHFTHKKALNEIIKFAERKEDLIHDDVYNWLDSIKKQEIKDYWIYREIKGAKLSENKSVKLGPFCIVDKNNHKDNIIKKSSYIQSNWEHVSNHCKGNLLIGVKVSVKNIDRGYELANKQFELFENTIKFIIPNNEEYEISIVNHVEPPVCISFAIADNSYNRSLSRSINGSEPINFNSSIFSDTNTWIQGIFSLLEKKKRSDVENRIVSAIDWVGKGLREFDKYKGFVQLTFGIEALLGNNDGRIIQPSILSRISESIAFTLGTDYTSRLKLEKDFKELYAIRSAIVHGGEKSVSTGEFMQLKYMVIKLIWAFIKNKELRNCHTINDYNDWIKNKRYNF